MHVLCELPHFPMLLLPKRDQSVSTVVPHPVNGLSVSIKPVQAASTCFPVTQMQAAVDSSTEEFRRCDWGKARDRPSVRLFNRLDARSRNAVGLN